MMANWKIEFFGFCDEPHNGHQKVWGYASVGESSTLYNFWGGLGKKFTFKRYEAPNGYWERNVLEELVRKKTAPGRKNGTYDRIDPKDISRLIPNFDAEFEHQLALAKLFDRFHGERQPD
jgi:hypothetical protein